MVFVFFFIIFFYFFIFFLWVLVDFGLDAA
jgi:hypothetical protein